jgi:folate-dependent phosphoribosylglycinamide formyltransferase PurN
MSRKNLVLIAIAEVLGRKTSAYHDLASAIERDDELGMILCQQSLDTLPTDKKTALWTRVRDLEDRIRSGEISEDGQAKTAKGDGAANVAV